MVRRGPIGEAGRIAILVALGNIAREKYNEYVTKSHNEHNYALGNVLRGALRFHPDPVAFENHYYLEGLSEKVTQLALYFEYGTGLYNTKGTQEPIKPKSKPYFTFYSKKHKTWIKVKEIKGVKPGFYAMKAIKYVENNVLYLRMFTK